MSEPEIDPAEERVAPPFGPDQIDILPLSIAVEGGLAILAILGGWLLGIDVNGQLNLDEVWDMKTSLTVAKQTVLGLLPMLGLLVSIEWLPFKPLVELRQFGRTQLTPLFKDVPIGGLLVIGLMAGLGEELLFRGLIQTAFSHWMPVWLAIILVGILFGVMHYVTVAYAVIAGLMGCYLGWLFLVSENIWVPILAHGIYDVVAFLYLRFQFTMSAQKN